MSGASVYSRQFVVLMFTIVVFVACVIGNWEGRRIVPAPAAGKVAPTPKPTTMIAGR
jgi:hypothetical protein